MMTLLTNKHDCVKYKTQNMKTKFSLITLLLFSYNSYSQLKLNVIFNDGTEKMDYYETEGDELLALSNNKRFHIDEIKELTYYTEKDTTHYYVVETKTYVESKKSKKDIARKAYDGENIELYYIYYNWTKIHTNSTMSFNSYDEAFVRRKGEEFVYNIGYIYGAGYKGIKKRVKEYFTDCPKLVEKVKQNKIKKNNSLEIVKYYDENCGK